VTDVPGLEIDGLAVMGTQERNARIRPPFGLSPSGLRPFLSTALGGKHCANQNQNTRDPKRTTLHHYLKTAVTGTQVDSTDLRLLLCDKVQSISAEIEGSTCSLWSGDRILLIAE
jgi:hypothetical protein